jgi:hypothetical protein
MGPNWGHGHLPAENDRAPNPPLEMMVSPILLCEVPEVRERLVQVRGVQLLGVSVNAYGDDDAQGVSALHLRNSVQRCPTPDTLSPANPALPSIGRGPRR